MNTCLKCGAQTKNPKFCCKSCACSFNNLSTPKRRPEGKCVSCNTVIKKKNKYCKSCLDNRIKDWSLVTLGELREARGHQKNSRVRDLARAIFKKSDKPKECAVCRYSLHYEVCHIKAISSYDENTPISVINDIDNLVGLCPTHHWELDNGHLSMPTSYRTSAP